MCLAPDYHPFSFHFPLYIGTCSYSGQADQAEELVPSLST